MEWARGAILGKGSFATVNLATLKHQTPNPSRIIAVKSATISQSSSLHNEKKIMTNLRGCPQILHCFGDDLTIENGQEFYNLFLEYVSGGTLADRLKNSGGPLPESHIRRYTRSIILGLLHIHAKGYVHCDIKPQNILVCPSSSDGNKEIKIADFGLAKVAGEKPDQCLKGTPLYMSPESVARNEYEPPTDIWSLGCVVAELTTGKPAWRCPENAEIGGLLFRIGFRDELPEIPTEFSDNGKDFLSKCFVRDPLKRWTAEMLLNHPFVADDETMECSVDDDFSSPRSPFDFPQWNSLNSCTDYKRELNLMDSSSTSASTSAPTHRIHQLAVAKVPNWSSSENWVIVRGEEAKEKMPVLVSSLCAVIRSPLMKQMVIEHPMNYENSFEIKEAAQVETNETSTSSMSSSSLPEFANGSDRQDGIRSSLSSDLDSSSRDELDFRCINCRRIKVCESNCRCSSSSSSSVYNLIRCGFLTSSRDCIDSFIINESKYRNFS